MKSTGIALATLALTIFGTAASATSFTNGGFETGSYSGWTVGAGSRAHTTNANLTTAMLLPGGSLYNPALVSHSAVVNRSYVDPRLGAALGSTVYGLNFSARVEDTTNGGYASVISQTVSNYTSPDIFFVWKAVLENGGHTANQSAEMLIELTDNTANQVVIRRQYNAGASGVGVDSRFADNGRGFFYTPQWQVEQLSLTATQIGHSFTLSVLSADCEPTGHTGYVYVDNFSSIAPPPMSVSEPASLSVLGLGVIGLAAVRRRKAS